MKDGLRRDQRPASSELEERYALLYRSARDPKEVAPISPAESAVAFGDVRGDRERRAIQLNDEEAIATLEAFSPCADLIRKIDGLLIDEELLEGEGHLALLISS